MEQISIFDFLDESEYLTEEEKIFNAVIDHGSNIEGSLKRIKRNINLPMREFIVFLIKEFGMGGVGYTGFHADWDSKGLQCGVEYSKMKMYSWETVAKAFKDKYQRSDVRCHA